jgi:hypothetical protein
VLDRDLLELAIDGFEWDDDNTSHLARHDVVPADVEAAYANDPLFLQNVPEQTATHVMIGPDARGRILFVAILKTETNGIWRAITSWESRAARRLYNQQRGA